MKRASLHTLGCRLNQAETAVLAARLQRDGYRVVEFGEPTDLLVVNTCSVTEDAERTCRYVIRKTLRHSPDAFVAVTGCYAQTGVHELRTIPGIDLIVGNQFKWDLPSFLPAPDALKKQPDPEVLHTRTIDREDFTLPEYGEPDSTRALLKIQDGCNVMCSFCLIPFARGHERSRLLDDVIQEAEILAAGGYREIVLTGVNVGQYRQGETRSGWVDRTIGEDRRTRANQDFVYRADDDHECPPRSNGILIEALSLSPYPPAERRRHHLVGHESPVQCRKSMSV